MAVSSMKAEHGGQLVAWQVVHLVIRWSVLCLHPFWTQKLLYQSRGLSIRNFLVGLILLPAKLDKTIL